MTSKKLTEISFTIPYRILSALKNTKEPQAPHVIYIQIPKQNRNYWLRKLVADGLIRKPKRGFYEITEIGKTSLEGLEKTQCQQLIRLENMRYKFPIMKNHGYLVNALYWPNIQEMMNLNIINTKFWGFTVRIFSTKTNPSLEITCKQKLGVNQYDLMYEARREVEEIALLIQGQWKIELGGIEQSMKPEWAIPSPISEAILSATQSSQIRSDAGVFNRSKGRKADWEVYDVQLAGKILEMPKNIKKLEEKIDKLTTMIAGSYNFSIF